PVVRANRVGARTATSAGEAGTSATDGRGPRAWATGRPAWPAATHRSARAVSRRPTRRPLARAEWLIPLNPPLSGALALAARPLLEKRGRILNASAQPVKAKL